MLAWILNLGFAASSVPGGNVIVVIGGPTSYRKWIPFELACRLHALQQGSLNIGNTKQNIANLQTLCVTNANAGGPYARWSRGFSNSATFGNSGPQPITALEVYPVLVPGFTKPPNT